MFRKTCNFDFLQKRRFTMVVSKQVKIPFYSGIGRQRGKGFIQLEHAFGRRVLSFFLFMSYQWQNMWVLACWSLLSQNLLKLLAIENISTQLQRMWEGKLCENSWAVVAGSAEEQ